MKSKNKSKKKIIDVRRRDEFEKGHAQGSINIPLHEIEQHLDEIKNFEETSVLVCGGGTRHIKAFDLLKAKGIKTEKGGSWKDFS